MVISNQCCSRYATFPACKLSCLLSADVVLDSTHQIFRNFTIQTDGVNVFLLTGGITTKFPAITLMLTVVSCLHQKRSLQSQTDLCFISGSRAVYVHWVWCQRQLVLTLEPGNKIGQSMVYHQ